jgi:DNA-directed RNA polymerase subunit N (RpoN/RPB10)
MIIPVRCMNCGKLLGDKFDFYQAELRKDRGGSRAAAPEPICLDGKTIPRTREAELFELLDLRRYCCKKTLNTHVDLISKL